MQERGKYCTRFFWSSKLMPNFLEETTIKPAKLTRSMRISQMRCLELILISNTTTWYLKPCSSVRKIWWMKLWINWLRALSGYTKNRRSYFQSLFSTNSSCLSDWHLWGLNMKRGTHLFLVSHIWHQGLKLSPQLCSSWKIIKQLLTTITRHISLNVWPSSCRES